jgi:hypothetical protein
MQPTTASDVTALLTDNAVVGKDRPLLTYYDDATGERSELSAVALGSWAARTAGLLRDGCGLGVVTAPCVAAAALANRRCAAGSLVDRDCRVAPAGGDTVTAGWARGSDVPLEVVFVARKRLDSWLEVVPEAQHRFVLGLTPQGALLDQVPAGYRDYLAEVCRYPDSPPSYESIRSTDAQAPTARATSNG